MSTNEIPPATTPETAPSRVRLPGAWFWAFLTIVVAGLIVFFTVVHLLKEAARATKETMREVVEAFRPELVVTTFHEWRELTAQGNDGNILEIATAEASEQFTRSSNVALFGKVLPLGTTVSEITVPATYRFHIDLNDEWTITSVGTRLYAVAPRVRPSLPVAFDTAGVRKKTQSGWARWDKSENLEALEREVSEKLAERAGQPATIRKVRDEGRLAVASFVQKWLVGQNAWAEDRFDQIVVVFADEEEDNLSRRPATLMLGQDLPPLL
jgi:hypothetical protein